MKQLLFIILSFSTLSGCSVLRHGEAVEKNNNGDLMYIEQQVHITDSQGHGPDIGSLEWCNAVNRRIFPEISVTVEPCSPEWIRNVQHTIQTQPDRFPMQAR